jgi:mono/diheme cytochrome c family protein
MDQGREIQRRRRWVGGRLVAALVLVVLGGQLLLGPAAPVAAQQSDAAAGKQLGCQLCHSTNGSAGVGPTWQTLAGAKVKLADGTTVTADDAFLVRSILDPDAEVVSGYRPGVMAAQFPAGALTQAQAEAIVAYLKTLRGGGAGGGQPAPGQGGPAVAEPARPAVFYAGWGLLVLGLLIAVVAILADVGYSPNFKRERTG